MEALAAEEYVGLPRVAHAHGDAGVGAAVAGLAHMAVARRVLMAVAGHIAGGAIKCGDVGRLQREESGELPLARCWGGGMGGGSAWHPPPRVIAPPHASTKCGS